MLNPLPSCPTVSLSCPTLFPRHAQPSLTSCPTPIGHLYLSRLPVERLPVKPAMTIWYHAMTKGCHALPSPPSCRQHQNRRKIRRNAHHGQTRRGCTCRGRVINLPRSSLPAGPLTNPATLILQSGGYFYTYASELLSSEFSRIPIDSQNCTN